MSTFVSSGVLCLKNKLCLLKSCFTPICLSFGIERVCLTDM